MLNRVLFLVCVLLFIKLVLKDQGMVTQGKLQPHRDIHGKYQEVTDTHLSMEDVQCTKFYVCINFMKNIIINLLSIFTLFFLIYSWKLIKKF